MNPADEAQVEQAKFNAREAKRQAGLLIEDVTTNALRFNEAAEQKLASGVAILGKTGNLGFEKSTAPSTGIDVDSTNGAPAAELASSLADLDAKITSLEAKLSNTRISLGSKEGKNPEYTAVQDQLEDARRSREALTVPGGLSVDVPEIKGPDSLLYASGSDLLAMTSLRDKMERDKRSLIRSGQSEAYTMLLAGENFTNQADYAKKAANYNMWTSILGGGIRVAKSFGVFG